MITILPEEIPNDAAPLETIPIEATKPGSTALIDGENVFVSLLTGKTLVGRLEWVNATQITVGNSDPIPRELVESARLV